VHGNTRLELIWTVIPVVILAAIGTVVFVGGAAFIAGGVILWLTAPSAPAQVGMSPKGPVVRGSF